MCEDAHEFLNFLINHINEIIVGEQTAKVRILAFLLLLFLGKGSLTQK